MNFLIDHMPYLINLDKSQIHAHSGRAKPVSFDSYQNEEGLYSDRKSSPVKASSNCANIHQSDLVVVESNGLCYEALGGKRFINWRLEHSLDHVGLAHKETALHAHKGGLSSNTTLAASHSYHLECPTGSRCLYGTFVPQSPNEAS